MKALIDFLPLIVFFISYFLSKNIFVATGFLISATIISLILSKLILKKIETMLLVTSFTVLVFGGLSLLFKDSSFIKAKTSFFGSIMAVAFYISHIVGDRRPIIQRLISSQISLSDTQWRVLSWMWIAFFLFEAILNFYIWKNFSEEIWVQFKVWGLLSISLIFMLVQGLFIYRSQAVKPN